LLNLIKIFAASKKRQVLKYCSFDLKQLVRYQSSITELIILAHGASDASVPKCRVTGQSTRS
jgi:hypothetical protein